MSNHPLTVLCVDDDADILTIIHMALTLDPLITAFDARSGEDALRLMASGLRPDVLLLDVRLGSSSGLEVARRMLTESKDELPLIIFLTASATRIGLQDLKSVGAAGVISKPFDPLSLAETVRKLAGRRQMR